MGRPINKRSFGQTIGQSIAIYANLGEGTSQFYIISQNGTSKYRIGNLGDTVAVGTVSLVPKEINDLSINEGTIIAYRGQDTFPVVKLLQNVVSVSDNGIIKSFSWKEENNGVVLLSELDDSVDDIEDDNEGV